MLGTAKSDVDEKGFIVHGLLSSLNSSVVWLSIKFIPTKETPKPSFILKTKSFFSKAELPHEGFALNFLPWDFLLIKSWISKKLVPPYIQLLKLT